MDKQTVRITIPDGVRFGDLQLRRDTQTGRISFNWRPIEAICAASGVDIAQFRDAHEDNVAGLIVAWYAEHRQQGGAEDSVAEQLIREAQAEIAAGLYDVTGRDN